MKESSQDIRLLNRQAMRVGSNLTLYKNMEVELFLDKPIFSLVSMTQWSTQEHSMCDPVHWIGFPNGRLGVEYHYCW